MNVFKKISDRFSKNPKNEKNQPGREERAKMSIPFSHPGSADPRMDGYRRISWGNALESPFQRNLSPLGQDAMQELAYSLYDTSGLVKRFVRDTKNFILGEGVTWTVLNDRDGSAKQVLEEFWYDSMNQMDIRLEKKIEFLGLLGEQCWPVAVNPTNGSVSLSYIDPVNISEVITETDFPEIPSGILVREGISDLRTNRRFSVIRECTDFHDNRYRRLVGDCFYFAVNNPPNGPRGRSDLIHLFDFINGFEEGLFDELDRLKLIKSFIWDVSLEGADDSEIRKFLSENKTPKPGSIRAHNERVKWEAVAPDLKMSDNKAFFDLMKTYLSACMNRPDSWLGSGGKAYQSEADLMGEPTFKDLGCRQRHVKYMLEFVLCFVLDQAVLHKRISPPGDRYSRFRVRVNMPKMTTRDLKKTVESINTLTDALDRARERGWVDDKTAAGLFESAIRRLGEDIQTPETEKRENQK